MDEVSKSSLWKFRLWVLFALVTVVGVGLAFRSRPGVLLSILYCLLAGGAVWAWRVLPEQVATNYLVDGRPQRMVVKRAAIGFYVWISVLLPLIGPGVVAAFFRFPGTDSRLLLRYALWFAVVLLTALLGHWAFYFAANRRDPIRLSPWAWAWTLVSVMGFVAWMYWVMAWL